MNAQPPALLPEAEPAAVRPLHTAVRGRARFKVAGLRRSKALKVFLEVRLARRGGIIRVRANPLTSNVLVLFTAPGDPAAVTALLERVLAEYGDEIERLREAYYRTNGHEGAVSGAPPPPWGPQGLMGQLTGLLAKEAGQPAEPWHLAGAGYALTRLGSSKATGLASAEARGRLTRYGSNVLPEAAPPSRLAILLDQFNSLPVALLAAAAALSLATGGVADALVILAVVAINAAIGYATESKAEAIIHSLKRLVRPTAGLLRGGEPVELPASEVVPGDVLILRPGGYVAADGRLLEAAHLSLDESVLTGESLPAVKTARRLSGRALPLADRRNMVYMGTLVTGGWGLGVVVATGRFTEVGRLQALAAEAAPPQTPLERHLRQVGNQLVAISGGVCGLVFALGLVRGYGLVPMLKSAVSLAVAAVPEGLPAVATTTLALGVASMRRHHVLVRHLEAVGTLGSVQTICLDKTGTITLNRMSVVRAWAGMRPLAVAEGAFREDGRAVEPRSVPELDRLIQVAALCNESQLNGEEGRYALKGSSTENALLAMALGAGLDVRELRRRFPLARIEYRSERRNYMTTFHRLPGGRELLAVKGSPAEVLAMCSRQLREGRQVPLSEDDRHEIESENANLAAGALRVLGLAFAVRGGEAATGDDGGFTWLGLLGMADPVRQGVPALVRRFHRAGLGTIMITGDQSPTAYAIGRQLDLSNGAPLEIFDSTRLAEVDPEVLRALSERVQIFARVSPAHKLEIVQALQQAGRVVAMTGDGVNDGPALKAADIGIAMGHTGTDIAREVADVILENDELETMLVAMGRSRTIHDNIRKSVHFLLATNLSEIIVMLLAIALKLGQPLSPLQLLWINIISDIFPGLALALEPPEPDVLERPPRDPREPIVSADDLRRVGLEAATLSATALAAYGWALTRYGQGPRAGAVAFQGLTSAQLLHALSCRSGKAGFWELPPNPYLTAALTGSLAVQALTIFFPPLRRLLGLTPLGRADALAAGAAALLPLAINEATKGRLPRRRP